VDELSIAIAGLRTAIVAWDPEVPGIVRDRYKGFLWKGATDWRIEVDARTAECRLSPDDVVVACDEGTARFRITRGDFAGAVDLDAHRGTVTFSNLDEFSVDSFVRVFYSLALVERQGLIAHAASLVRHGRAHLFPGRSGSGKTTLTRLSPEATLLSDELSIVRGVAGEIRCYGTPFWGELARAGEDQAAPLAGIYFIRHGEHHVVEALRPRQALERLLPNVVFFTRDIDLMTELLSIAAHLVETVPCFDLAFRPDPGFWEVIDHD
jgi:hypothetical protein